VPNLPDLQDRTENETPHSIFLAPECWVLFLAVFEFLDDLGNWSGAGDDLSTSEIDGIQALVAKAYEQVMDGQVGDVRWLAGACPANMLLCDGSSYLRVDYPDLYDFLDAVYQTDSSHFVVPDMLDRAPIGAGGSRNIDDAGGAETHTLVLSESPSHSHTDTGHTHTEVTAVPVVVTIGAGAPVPSAIPGVGVTGLGFAALTNTGGDGAHNNMQPFRALLPCIVAL
jgi:microcystin-dependent protein